MFGLPIDVDPGLPKAGQSCWTCERWSGLRTSGGGHAICWHRYPESVTVIGLPDRGCVYWLRAIGSDDENPESSRLPVVDMFSPEFDDDDW